MLRAGKLIKKPNHNIYTIILNFSAEKGDGRLFSSQYFTGKLVRDEKGKRHFSPNRNKLRPAEPSSKYITSDLDMRHLPSSVGSQIRTQRALNDCKHSYFLPWATQSVNTVTTWPASATSCLKQGLVHVGPWPDVLAKSHIEFPPFLGTHSLRRNRSFSDTSGHSSQQTTSYLPAQISQQAIFSSTCLWPVYPTPLTTHHWARLFFLNSFLADLTPFLGIVSKDGLNTKNTGSCF